MTLTLGLCLQASKMIIRVEIFKNPFSASHIYECANEHFKDISINIKCGFLAETLKKMAKLSSEILLLLFFKIARKCSAISDHLSLLTRHFFSWIDNVHPSGVQFLHLFW